MGEAITVPKTLVLKVGDNEYNITSPKTGQIIDVEMNKARLAGGAYGKMVGNYNKLSIFSLDMIDMFAHFRALCPDLLADLQVEDWGDLDPYDTLDLFKAYSDQLKPWYDKLTSAVLQVWGDITTSIEKPAVDDKAKEQKEQSS